MAAQPQRQAEHPERHHRVRGAPAHRPEQGLLDRERGLRRAHERPRANRPWGRQMSKAIIKA